MHFLSGWTASQFCRSSTRLRVSIFLANSVPRSTWVAYSGQRLGLEGEGYQHTSCPSNFPKYTAMSTKAGAGRESDDHERRDGPARESPRFALPPFVQLICLNYLQHTHGHQ